MNSESHAVNSDAIRFYERNGCAARSVTLRAAL